MKIAIQKALNELADPAKGKEISSYMKNVLPFRGLQQPQIAEVFSQFRKEVQGLSYDEKFDLADQLMREDYGEDKKIALMVAEKMKFDLQYIKSSEKWFTEGHIKEWATADTYCGRILKHFICDKENAKYMLQWAKHENLWLRRSSCVGFVTLVNKKKCDIDLLFEICQENIVHQERFNQLGTGWLLREISRVQLDQTLAFIQKNIQYFSSEGLRYAYEKMKAQDQSFLKTIFKENKEQNQNQQSNKNKESIKLQKDYSDQDFQIVKKNTSKKRKL